MADVTAFSPESGGHRSDIDHESDEDCPCGPTPIFVDGGIVYRHHRLIEDSTNQPLPPALPADMAPMFKDAQESWKK